MHSSSFSSLPINFNYWIWIPFHSWKHDIHEFDLIPIKCQLFNKYRIILGFCRKIPVKAVLFYGLHYHLLPASRMHSRRMMNHWTTYSGAPILICFSKTRRDIWTSKIFSDQWFTKLDLLQPLPVPFQFWLDSGFTENAIRYLTAQTIWHSFNRLLSIFEHHSRETLPTVRYVRATPSSKNGNGIY